MQGKSLLSLLDRQIEEWRNEVYIGMREFMTGRVLRTPEWTYAIAAPKHRGWRATERSEEYVEYMMYDLSADPFQHTNLAGRAEYKAVSEKLRERLLSRIVEAGDPKPTIEQDWFPYS
jgi:hypothetical protein